jgi:phage recombination protein Bet
MPTKKKDPESTPIKASDPSSLVPSNPAPEEKPTLPVLKVDMAEIALNVEAVQKYLCAKANRIEIELFLQTCSMWNLNPFKREIYLVKYSDTQPASTVIGYESFLKRADRTARLSGWKTWTEGVPKQPGFRAIVEIHRKDWLNPFTHEVYYEEYVQKNREGQITRFWNEKPRTMIKKVAIAQAFRMCFPDELGGMPYLAEEVMDAEVIDVTPIKTGGGAQPDGPGKSETGAGQEKATAVSAGPSPLPPPPPPPQTPAQALPRPRPAPVPAAPKPVPRPVAPPPAKQAAPDDGPLDEELPQALDTDSSESERSADDGVARADGEMWDEQIRQCVQYLIDRCGRNPDSLFGIILKRIKDKFGREVTEITGPELDDEQKQWLVELLKKTIASDEAKAKAGKK